MRLRVDPEDDMVLSAVEGDLDERVLQRHDPDLKLEIDGRRYEATLHLSKETGCVPMLERWADQHACDVAHAIQNPPLILPKSIVEADGVGGASPISDIWKPGATTGGGNVSRLRTWLTLAWLGQSHWSLVGGREALGPDYWVSLPQRYLRPFVERRPALGPVALVGFGTEEQVAARFLGTDIPGFADPTRRIGEDLQDLATRGYLESHPSDSGVRRVAVGGRPLAVGDGPRHVFENRSSSGSSDYGTWFVVGRWTTSGSYVEGELESAQRTLRVSPGYPDLRVDDLFEGGFWYRNPEGLINDDGMTFAPMSHLSHMAVPRFVEISRSSRAKELGELWRSSPRGVCAGSSAWPEAGDWFEVPSVVMERVINRLAGPGLVVMLVLLAQGLAKGRAVQAPRGRAEAERLGVSTETLRLGLKNLQAVYDGEFVDCETRSSLGRTSTSVSLRPEFGATSC